MNVVDTDVLFGVRSADGTILKTDNRMENLNLKKRRSKQRFVRHVARTPRPQDEPVLPQGFDKRTCEGCGGDGKWVENGVPYNCDWCNGHGFYFRKKVEKVECGKTL